MHFKYQEMFHSETVRWKVFWYELVSENHYTVDRDNRVTQNGISC
jgi:hypothetical protein